MTGVPRAPLLLVLAAATAIRLVSWLEIRDGPLLYLHRWTESDMAFFDQWAGAIVGGDVLGRVTPRPYHSGHAGVAREAHRLLAMREPFDEVVGRRLWNRWLGEHTFYQEPLYPYVLAAIYGVAGRRVGAAIFVQALFGVAAAGLVYPLPLPRLRPRAGPPARP